MIKQNQRFLNGMLVVFDMLAFLLSYGIAWFIKFQSGLFPLESHLSFIIYAEVLLFTLPCLLAIQYLHELYMPQRTKHLYIEILNIIKSNFSLFILIMSVLYIAKQIHISRMFIALLIIFNIALSAMERASVRIALRNIRAKGYNIKYVFVVGGGQLGRNYLKAIYRNRYLGYVALGIFDDSEVKQGKKIVNTRVIGQIGDLENALQQHHVDEVIIALPIQAYDRLKGIINICEKSGVKTLIIPDYIRYMPARPHFDEIEDIPLINTRYVPLDNIGNRMIKRAFDIITAASMMIVFGPIMLVITAVIKISSPGPVIFKQERIGFNRRPFVMYKFRTMKNQKKEQSDTTWTTKEDDRKTKFGEFLRATSLDELPQIFNVLKGDMSIIGPRPERPYFVDQFKEKIPKYMIKHHVRPGLTGWAQVNGWRGDTSIKERIKHDIYYIENWSLMFDIRILWLTVFKGFINKNAY
ncbi:undecaprenyl-phosphate glucose phosphotransferase [Petroclostridium sp. X23]|uniref:undecaprenyl-phosphate glucose phosphotransferase n=1 Tax=Petroclostridium sp. X23 TaxID=3045146 RepID=UPI0024AE18A6|nr:undecaprenyl-phosphate glucose phosphotransferase [Petroclostridium sp. X23]WHH57425.1 undecaprenyl-phosphate glucose phosphotransferase [Petroclostridium sp. X23]